MVALTPVHKAAHQAQVLYLLPLTNTPHNNSSSEQYFVVGQINLVKTFKKFFGISFHSLYLALVPYLLYSQHS